MRQLLKLTLTATLIMCASMTYGQTQKFGYINSNELISIMPEVDSVQIKLQKLNDDFVEQLELIQVEFNNKYQEWQKNAATYSDAINQMKQQELQELEQRYTDNQTFANQTMTQTQQELMAPIAEKAENAIKKVGQANSFLVIFDQAQGPIIYFDEQNMVDVLPLVKAELGITE